jgi:hypothetical protein
MCVGEWSSKGFVKSKDIDVAMEVPEVEGEEDDLKEEWDVIEMLYD